MFIIAESNQLYLGDMLFYLVSFLIMAALVWHFEIGRASCRERV